MATAIAPAAPDAKMPPKRPPGPSLRQIHSQPVPIRTFPLPAFYPSNPISLLHLTYLWLKQIFLPPPDEPSVSIHGLWNEDSRSVLITDDKSMRILWEQGFYGKGHLSRSEPNWLKREQVRRGIIKGDVSEEFTVSRREDRQRLKWLRAKAEQQAIEKTKASELKAPVGPLELLALPNSLADLQALPRLGLAKMQAAIVAVKDISSAPDSTGTKPINGKIPAEQNGNPVVTEEVVNREYLQLTREEAFFLVFAIGCLTVVDADQETISTEEVLSHFRSYSYFPPRAPELLSPGDPFLVQYAVYHHFRSLGWCPRPGIKFGVDWLLYLDGPAFNHGEFGVIVLPSFSDRRWEGHPSVAENPPRSWHWLMGTVRVLSHVFKDLVLVYVDIPPPPVFDQVLRDSGFAAALKKFKIREVMVRRWSSNRNR